MSRVFAIFSKDVKSYFFSITAYIVITIFLTLSGFFFSTAMSYFSLYSFQASSQPYLSTEGLNLTDAVLGNLFFNICVILLLMIPVLTMRLMAEEQKEGTLELLLTYPVNEKEVVLGKFLAAGFVFAVMLLPTMTHLFLLRWLGGTFEWGVVASGGIGLFLMGMAFISFGIFSSSLSENQIIGAVISFGFLLLLWMLAWVSQFVPPAFAGLAGEFSLIRHVEDFFKGIVEVKNIVYYLLFTFFFFLLTVWRLEARKWVR
ncbi:MAG TPA: ABC transporter permease [Candidatus Omnitrophota bacterium]|nr:ABC transporter permease [Candidatus Omnitrophota bacterium]